MTGKEWDEWFADFAARFPAATGWIFGGKSDPEIRAIKLTWVEVMKGLDKQDVLAVSRKVQSGELEQWASNDKIPAFFAHHGRMERINRNARPETEDWRRNSYKCLLCRDSGMVYCWHPQALRWLQRGNRLEPGCGVSHHSYAVPCSCPQGDTKRTMKRAGRTIQLPTYSDSNCCLLTGDTFDLEQQEIALAWIARVSNPKKAGDKVLAGFNEDV